MYTLSRYSNKIKKDSTGETFIQDDSNTLYIDYIEWLKLEGTPYVVDYFEEEEGNYSRQYTPKIVSQRQLRTQLVLNGFDLNDIQESINTLTEPNKSIAQIAWDYAITFERESPLLICIGNNLGLTEAQIDEIFKNGSKL